MSSTSQIHSVYISFVLLLFVLLVLFTVTTICVTGIILLQGCHCISFSNICVCRSVNLFWHLGSSHVCDVTYKYGSDHEI